MLETNASKTEEPEYLTSQELADLLCYSREYINKLARRKWFNDGVVLESPGGHRRFKRKEALKQFGSVYRKRRAK